MRVRRTALGAASQPIAASCLGSGYSLVSQPNWPTLGLWCSLKRGYQRRPKRIPEKPRRNVAFVMRL